MGNWSSLAEVRMGAPRYTSDNHKLYPVYLHREEKKTIEKNLTPHQAELFVSDLENLFIWCDKRV